MTSPLLLLLRDKKYLAITISIAVVLFSFEYYLMATLPGARNYQCVIGGFLTPFNMTFGFISSLLMGLMVAGIIAVTAERHENAAAATSLGSIGTVVGLLTTFCTLCTLPVLTLFGLSFGLEIFTTYNLALKITSMTLLLVGLYLINNQLGQECRLCTVSAKRKNGDGICPSPPALKAY